MGDPPTYTGKPPVILGLRRAAMRAPPPVGAGGNTLIIRASGSSLDVTTSGGVAGLLRAQAARQAPRSAASER
jgi:hypothetical protein